MSEIYFDNASTTKMFDDDIEKYFELLKKYYANVNSSHKLGVEALKVFEIEKKQLNSLFPLFDIIFTSGASESNNLAIMGIANRHSKVKKHIITSKMEHPSVLNTISALEKKGFEVDYIDSYIDGEILFSQVEKLLREDTLLVSLMSVNNEVGSISDVSKIAKLIKEKSSAFFHCDMSQSIGKLNFNYENIDLITFSAHKIHSLKGVGFLLKKKQISLTPLIYGGGQQENLRSGTINYLSNVIAMKTIRKMILHIDDSYKYIKDLNTYFLEKLSKIENIEVLNNKKSSPYIISIYLKDKKVEVVFNALSNKLIFVSTKSACSSEDKSFSKSVFALCKDKKKASNSIRISLSIENSKEEIDVFIEEIKKITEGVI